eukprot:TRINITY_DN16555_c0_g1_i1.p1 TRINITY_DN16555_c0_g1~~TRINITY_DN16555_c0_g1_i1.p1  ORF type:complete len:758 (-),score=143.73 TRINITY_DN16555_c0_g1_i1:121-2322(-)
MGLDVRGIKVAGVSSPRDKELGVGAKLMAKREHLPRPPRLSDRPSAAHSDGGFEFADGNPFAILTPAPEPSPQVRAQRPPRQPSPPRSHVPAAAALVPVAADGLNDHELAALAAAVAAAVPPAAASRVASANRSPRGPSPRGPSPMPSAGAAAPTPSPTVVRRGLSIVGSNILSPRQSLVVPGSGIVAGSSRKESKEQVAPGLRISSWNAASVVMSAPPQLQGGAEARGPRSAPGSQRPSLLLTRPDHAAEVSLLLQGVADAEGLPSRLASPDSSCSRANSKIAPDSTRPSRVGSKVAPDGAPPPYLAGRRRSLNLAGAHTAPWQPPSQAAAAASGDEATPSFDASLLQGGSGYGGMGADFGANNSGRSLNLPVASATVEDRALASPGPRYRTDLGLRRRESSKDKVPDVDVDAVRAVDTYIFDVNSSIFESSALLGHEATAKAAERLNELLALGKNLLFATNNARVSQRSGATELAEKGVLIPANQAEPTPAQVAVAASELESRFVTVGWTCGWYLRRHGLRRPLVITSSVAILQDLACAGVDFMATCNTEGATLEQFTKAVTAERIESIAASLADVDAVVLCYDADLNVLKIAVAARLLWGGNPDVQRLVMPLLTCCPPATKQKFRTLGKNSMCQALGASFDPEALGVDMRMPSATLLEALASNEKDGGRGINVATTIVIGSSVDTAVEFANASGMRSCLLTSTLLQRMEVNRETAAARVPTWMASGLADL